MDGGAQHRQLVVGSLAVVSVYCVVSLASEQLVCFSPDEEYTFYCSC